MFNSRAPNRQIKVAIQSRQINFETQSKIRLMKLIIYADESGTHDPTGQLKGSEVPVVAGYAAFRDDWKKFCRDWKTILDRYKVPYFHAFEFEDRDDRKTNTKSPYYLWDDTKAENFKYALAEIAGRNIPISGGYNIQEHHKRHKEDETYPYKYAFDQFFIDLGDMLVARNWTSEKISLIFDRNNDEKWDFALRKEVEWWSKNGLNLNGFTYVNKKEFPHWPLQAADMLAYRSRRMTYSKLKKQAEQNKMVFENPTVFDVMLNRNLRPKIGFNPTVTNELSKEISELTQKHSSVRRALLQIPNNYLRVK
jgi:uncharacterized protein DUF3800